MLNLDNIINQSEEVCIFGERIHVKQPTILMVMDVKKIEEDLDQTNILEKRLDVALVLLNNNSENRKYTREELMELPRVAVEALVVKISEMNVEADQNPN